MRLKKLTLQGFKSFVDKTEVTFEDGITSVVGPNGSGKSNISDALRWVLGEQSVKTLRGGKMGDVIFAGTEKRSPVGFCKVELVFDNEDKWLNVDFNEVAVARKYYKSGESAYSINNNECRLKDILELFRDTGVGKEGYSIVGQGQVTNILSSNTGERRMVFEAATGILKYKSRKSDAQSRLIKTGDNIDRLRDLLDEINANLENLEGQSKQAKEYLEHKAKLHDYEIARFIYKTQDREKRLRELAVEMKDIETAVTNGQRDIEQMKAHRDQLMLELDDANKMLEKLKNDHIYMREGMLKSGSQTEVTFERIKGLNENINTLTEQNASLGDEIDGTKEQLEETIQRQHKITRELENAEQEYENKSREHGEIRIDLDKKTAGLDEMKQQRILFLNSVSEVKVNSSKYSTMLESIENRMKDIESGKRIVEGKLKNLNNDKDKLEQVRRELTEKKLGLEEKKLKFQQQRQEIAEMKEQALQGIHQCEVECGSVKSKFQLLKNMQKEYEGYNFAVKNLMKLAERNREFRNKICGTVADIIDVDKSYVAAIETALGGALQNIVTGTEQDAKALIEVLKRENLGRATFLPISSVRPTYLNNDEQASLSAIPGVMGSAVDLVRVDKRYAPIIQKLLGRTVVVENMDSAIALMRKNSFRFQTVTLDGEIMHAGGAISGGSKSRKGVGLLSRNDEITALEEKLTQLEAQTTKHNSTLAGVDGEISAIETAFLDNKHAMKDIYERLDSLQNEISIYDAQIEGEMEKLVASNEELEQLTDNKLDIEDKLKLVSGGNPSKTSAVDEDAINILSKEVYELRQKNEAFHEQISVLLASKSGLEKDVDVLKRDGERFSREIASKKAQAEKNTLAIENINKQIDELKQTVEQKQELNKESILLEKKLKLEIGDAEGNVYLLQTKLKECESSIDQNRESIREHTDRKYKIEVESSKLAMEGEMLDQDMFERYDLTYEDAHTMELPIELGIYKKEIDRLKSRIKEMGNVNLNSIDEYAYTHARHEQITSQLVDLIDSKRDLEELIEMLQKDMTSQFKEQFALINTNFTRIFKSLFGGGKAELILNKDESVLESDIEIVAQPPGKKLQTISLLSGGEKSLTAIAILFAMLELKPTPFCVLDEIDSALDEANVYSFANYLKNYADKTQFIVITHKRGVMELSDAIYGIAMQEKGVSKVVSIRLEENKGGSLNYGAV